MKTQQPAYLRDALVPFFDVVSSPLFYQGQGPNFMTVRFMQDKLKFAFFAVIGTDAFIAAPADLPAVFENRYFMFEAVDGMMLDDVQQSGKYFSLSTFRLVPDSPSCRLTLQQLQKNRPDLLSGIYLMDDSGSIFSASSVVDNPVVLS